MEGAVAPPADTADCTTFLLDKHVFPVKACKRPACPQGYKDALPYAAARKKWASCKRWGVVPGRSGHIVLDVDVKNGAKGMEALKVLQREHPEIDGAFTVRTPSGGLHIWFRLPKSEAPIGNFSPWSGIDVRAHGGYVLAPGSRIKAGSYEIEKCPEQELGIPLGVLSQLRGTESAVSDVNPAVTCDAEWQRAERALMALSPDMPHDDWVRIGMALHASGRAEAQGVFDAWSRGSEKYDGVERVWSSFSHADGGVGLGTLFMLSKEAVGAEDAAYIDPDDPLGWTDLFTVSDEDMAQISDPEWLIEDMFIKGHFIVIPAPPNGGKTTVLLHLAGEMVQRGATVFYVNADVASTDAKSMHILAKQSGFKLMLPDLQVGLSMADIVAHIKTLASSNAELAGNVFIFDTLKKDD